MPGVLATSARAWDEHAAFMDRLVDEDFMIQVGPIGSGESTMQRSTPLTRTRSGPEWPRTSAF